MILYIFKIFQTFQFLLFFSSTCNIYSSLRGPIQFLEFQKLTCLLILYRNWCFVWWTIWVFIKKVLSGLFVFLFSLLLAYSGNNRSQWFSILPHFERTYFLFQYNFSWISINENWIKIHKFQIIANDLNGCKNLRFWEFLRLCVNCSWFFEFLCVFSIFLWLILSKDRYH